MNIGFVGLGAMGRPMATRIAGAGHLPVVFDVDTVAAQRLATEANVRIAKDREDFRETDIVVTMLPTSAIVREALIGAGGIAAVLRSGALIIDMSSSEPEETRQLGAVLANKGIALVDAPVSGGVPRATNGQLTIMIGGTPADIQRARPVLELMGSKLFEVGALGAGHAMKALNNYVSAAAMPRGSCWHSPRRMSELLRVSRQR